MQSITHISEVHDIDPHSGFCRRCANHYELVAYENLQCVWADNSSAITHLRYAQEHGKREAAKALFKLGEPQPGC